MLDFQVELTETDFAKAALVKAVQAIKVARREGMLVIYGRVGFRSGSSDVAGWNPVFGPYAAQNLLPLGSSMVAPVLSPADDEPVVVNRGSAILRH